MRQSNSIGEIVNLTDPSEEPETPEEPDSDAVADEAVSDASVDPAGETSDETVAADAASQAPPPSGAPAPPPPAPEPEKSESSNHDDEAVMDWYILKVAFK